MSPLMHGAVYGVVMLSVLLSATAIGIWFERRLAGRMQSRIGPNRVGPVGLLQPIADFMKLLQKEEIVPYGVDAPVFKLAPLVAGVCAFGVAAVVPWGPDLVAADLDIGVLFILALGGLTAIAVFMAGWGSNNKYALLGGMRAIGQAISYEVPLVLCALVPVILAGSMNVQTIVRWQAAHHWIAIWPTLPGLPAFVIFFMCLLAESNRIPFDIPEAESELVAGVTTEYTGMKFALFYLGEYFHTLVGSAVGAALFLGGWDGPFAPGVGWMVGKTILLFALVYWVRWTLLRLRADQMLALAWRYLVPVSVALVLLAALWVELGLGGTS
jgi:NADH-quinone oxidoreductase subunit H